MDPVDGLTDGEFWAQIAAMDWRVAANANPPDPELVDPDVEGMLVPLDSNNERPVPAARVIRFPRCP